MQRKATEKGTTRNEKERQGKTDRSIRLRVKCEECGKYVVQNLQNGPEKYGSEGRNAIK